MPSSWTNPAGTDLHLELPPGRGRRAALETALREAVRMGRLVPGQQLPSSRVLAAELEIARGTVVEAYAQLTAEGYLRAKPGAGTEVAGQPGERPSARPETTTATPSVDFRFGRPDVSAFPRNLWLRSLRRAVLGAPDSALGLADPRGSPQLRTVLAGYLGRVRGVLTRPQLVLTCGGFTQGLRLVCDALVADGKRRIAFEDPCLPEHRAIAAAAGMRISALPVDEHGARTEPAEEVDAIVLTPAHQAPTGATLSPARRTAFLRLGVPIIEDDYNGEFRYDRQPIGAMQGLAPDRVIYMGSVSKALAPGIRLGWLVLPPDLLDGVLAARRNTDRGTSAVDQLALAEFISGGGFDRHVRRMRLRYRRRRDQLTATLAEAAPWLPLTGTTAGLHALATLPDGGPGETEIRELGKRQSIALTGLSPFWHDTGAPGLVLGYATPAEHAYRHALDQLAGLLSGFGEPLPP